MSAEWQMQSAESWKVTLPCNRAEGELLAVIEPELGIDPAPVLMTSEPDPSRPDNWQFDVYLPAEPGPDLVAAIRALVPSAGDTQPVIERLEDQDWVTVSQRWLQPIRAGRFYVHTAAFAENIPADMVAFHIEAGRAFGTGHHETTAGCLEMLDRMAGEGLRFGDVADIGTGTGLLAFAARILWPDARVIASDIDPVAIDVTAANMAANGVPGDAIALVAADGMDGPALRAAAPFDLLIANILAGPLIALAPGFGAAIRPGASILLAGLLASQADDVLSAYARHGITLHGRIDKGDWSILWLRSAPVKGA
ncbi:50S ribosomal protein L11 methyltransferase [uncultured Sphingomonas sp.]|uniref:50S ribosomal protein L11 methyltransferase n=1 Tax=uncultured Sphingomonas sp. TaxID=158754 RepID=UPI0025FE40F9|nr:50S ribosomal protein L11 methyltransferase [uncultured Sphingomonas sp.]